MRKHKNSRHTERARACSIQRISEEKTPLCVVLLSKKKEASFLLQSKANARCLLESKNKRCVCVFVVVFWREREKEREKREREKQSVIFLGFHIF